MQCFFHCRCVPSHEAIDLLNVAFEQQPPHTNSKNSHRKKEAEPRKDPFEVPDRISGRAGVKELNPKRRWNFVEVSFAILPNLLWHIEEFISNTNVLP